MSDIVGELARVREAFDRPTLSLLARKWAPLVLAVFKISFGREQRTVTAERLHTQVDTYLEELRSTGEEVPPLAGRALCLQWMSDQWLVRTIGDGGEEEYSLTSHALEALDLVQSLSSDRVLISESRINTILDAVRRWATEANPDRGARIRRLDVQIEQLTSERDRLAGGGEVALASDDRMLDGYANLLDLIEQLPSDFKRVEESVLAMHRQILSDFRSDDRPIGEVLDEYLKKTDELTQLTPEGRAFDGAFMLLRDDALLLELKTDLQTILSHPFSEALTPAEHRDFRGALAVIRRGITDILAQRSRLSATLREHIVHHDVIRDRELDATLRQIHQQLESWMVTARPRSSVPVAMMPAKFAAGHLRERLWDPASAVPPPALEDVSATAPPPPSLEDIRTQGGPSLPRLRASLAAAAAGDGGADTLGALFNELPVDLRRPVEILGLLHLTADFQRTAEVQPEDAAEVPQDDAIDQLDDTGLGGGAAGFVEQAWELSATETFEAVRPDGSRRRFRVPALALRSGPVRAGVATTGARSGPDGQANDD